MNTRGAALKQATDSVYLSDLSPKDKTWDKRRGKSDGIQKLYLGTRYHEYSQKISNCSQLLDFSFEFDDTGVARLRLQAAWLCRCRHCAVCQGRRSLKWAAKTFKIMPKALEEYPKARFVMLTLTIRNCPLDELRHTLSHMHESWRKLLKRKEWKVLGWIRATEVTRSKTDDTAHPHYHCLLMVKPSYFTGENYISQQRWREMWGECLKVSYEPWIDVRAVKERKDFPKDLKDDPVMSAVVETVKYAVKPEDILRGNNCHKPGERVRMTDQEWLVELTSQLYKTRAIATGGILKEYLKVLEDERQNEKDSLIYINEDGEYEPNDDSPRIRFSWDGGIKRYSVSDNFS